MAGPVWTSPGASAETKIGHGIGVPHAFWKVAVVLPPNATAGDVAAESPVVAAIMPNVEGIASDGWIKYRTTLAAIERRIGYHALSRVRAEVLSALREKAQ
jgi:endonuclease G